MKENYILLMHEFAADRLDSGFTYKEMTDYLHDRGVDVESVLESISLTFEDITMGGSDKDEKTRHLMYVDSYFRYLDYLEMKEAHENASKASKQAIWAIIIASALGVIQIIIGTIQILSNYNCPLIAYLSGGICFLISHCF